MNNLFKKIFSFIWVFVHFVLVLYLSMKNYINKHIETVIVISWFLLIGALSFLVINYG